MLSEARQIVRVALGLAFAAALVSTMPHAASGGYIIADIGPGPAGGALSVGGINRSGASAGLITVNTGGTTAFRADGRGGVESLGLLNGGTYTEGRDVNAAGRVVGTGNTLVNGRIVTRGYYTDGPGAAHILDPLSDSWGRQSVGSVGNAINDGNQIAGTATFQGGQSMAFRADGLSPLIGLGTLGGVNSQGFGINNSGMVVGVSDTYSGTRHAFASSGSGSMIDLGILAGGTFSQARAINDAGIVVGSADSMGVTYAVRRSLTSGGWQSLGTLPSGGSSYANAINAGGDIVGAVTVGPNLSAAFLFTEAHGMLDLNTLLDPDSGWSLTSASGINDHGQIVGNGYYLGQSRGFLLTPSEFAAIVPEPPALALLLTGLVSLGVMRTLRRSSH
ncbi:hypothetical protein EP7_000822 [Isosphaeraceae bacterium EP7]